MHVCVCAHVCICIDAYSWMKARVLRVNVYLWVSPSVTLHLISFETESLTEPGHHRDAPSSTEVLQLFTAETNCFVWCPGIELRSSDWHSKHFTH